MTNRILAGAGLLAVMVGGTAYGISERAAAAPLPERHPELRRALRALERARGDLMNAARDFGGHRAKAEELTEAAISQVQEAMRSDRQ